MCNVFGDCASAGGPLGLGHPKRGGGERRAHLHGLELDRDERAEVRGALVRAEAPALLVEARALQEEAQHLRAERTEALT